MHITFKFELNTPSVNVISKAYNKVVSEQIKWNQSSYYSFQLSEKISHTYHPNVEFDPIIVSHCLKY